MGVSDLHRLVQRRLFELGETPAGAARRSRWSVAPETIALLAGGRRSGLITERLAQCLAMALDIPQNRVRRAAGLPPVPDPREDEETVPHLRLIRGGACGRP